MVHESATTDLVAELKQWGRHDPLVCRAIAEIERLREYVATAGGFPWRGDRLADWSIVGMNHYRQDGEPRLFVSMERRGRCIKAEGPDDGRLWAELERQAFLVKETPDA